MSKGRSVPLKKHRRQQERCYGRSTKTGKKQSPALALHNGWNISGGSLYLDPSYEIHILWTKINWTECDVGKVNERDGYVANVRRPKRRYGDGSGRVVI